MKGTLSNKHKYLKQMSNGNSSRQTEISSLQKQNTLPKLSQNYQSLTERSDDHANNDNSLSI